MPPDNEQPHTGRLMTVLTQEAVEWMKQAAGAVEFTDLGQFRGPGHAELQQILKRHATVTFRAVRSVGIPEIIDLEKAAQEGPFRPAHSLLAYWIVSPAPGAVESDLAALEEALNRLRQVFESVQREEAVGAPPVNWQNDKYARDQFHLNEPPKGIDAKYAWRQGIDGAGIGFADVEMGWNRSHQDLKSKMPSRLLTHRNYAKYADHGTAVLGLVVGSDNAKGIVGIAPGVTSVFLASHWDRSSANNVADAVATAATRLRVGDVLLLEAQTAKNDPIELLAGGAELTAIQVAASRGLIVIEAAGNGGRNLDPSFPATRPDSGAIMVGASVGNDPPPSMKQPSHARLVNSNYGARVDCFAPGICLVTAGGGDLDAGGGATNRKYSAAFRNTSGASAIVAGVAILAQHMSVTSSRLPLDARKMKAVLTQTGRKQSAPDGNIGMMPDLRRIAGRLLGNVVPA